MKIHQPADGFRYNTDSLLLYHFALTASGRGTILDIGCGSGVVGLLLARDLETRLTGLDKQQEMIDYAVHNARLGGIDAEFFCMDVADFRSGERFGLIVCNPPFYPSQGTLSANPSKNIARYATHMPFETLAERANSHLHNKGSFVFCYEARGLQELMGVLRRYKLHAVRVQLVHPDASKEARLVLVEARKYAAGSAAVMAPLFMDDEPLLQTIRQRAGTTSMT